MPLFRYEALDRTGTKVVGAMQVADEATLTSRLATMGYQPIAIQQSQTSLRPSTGSHQAAPPSQGPPVSRLSASKRSLARMLHQLYISFRAGMPAYQALSTVAGQVHDRPLRQALMEIAAGVSEGNHLSAQMERYPRIFSPGDVGMIRAAEIGGFLPEAFAALAQQHEQDDNTNRRLRIWVWFFHSNVLGLFLTIPAAYWMGGAIPNLDVRMGFAAAGHAFMKLSLPLTVGYFAGLYAFYRGRNNPAWTARWHRMLMGIPMAGQVNKLRAQAVFSRVLQQLYLAGVVSASAWETAAAAVPNVYLSGRLAQGKHAVESTGKISAGLQATGMHDPADIGMVATGEATGEVPQALSYLANRYEEETRVTLGSIVIRGAIWSVLLGLGMGGIALAIVMSGYGNAAIRILDGLGS